MLDQLRKGDVVAVWKLDRLARSTRNLLEIVEMIRNAGARFRSISEPSRIRTRFDSGAYWGRSLFFVVVFTSH